MMYCFKLLQRIMRLRLLLCLAFVVLPKAEPLAQSCRAAAQSLRHSMYTK